MQRSRSPSETANGIAKRQRLQPISPFLTYQFLWPMMHKYLDDADVLTPLLLTCKAMKPLLMHYALKSAVTPYLAIRFTGWHFYLPINVTHMEDVMREDLRAYTSLETISFNHDYNDDYNKPILPGIIPLSVKRITLAEKFNRPIDQHVLPPGLTHLEFGQVYNQIIEPHVLPDSLTELKLNRGYNQPMAPGALPPSLRTIEFPGSFNQPIPPGLLPELLTEVCFGDNFNQPLEIGSLPSSIKTVSFGYNFNQSLHQFVLPPSIEKLKIGNGFEGPLHLPPKLQVLVLWSGTSKSNITNDWPSSLTELHLSRDQPESLPNSIIKLSCDIPLARSLIPSSVTELFYKHHAPLHPGFIPDTVRTLRINMYRHLPLEPGVIPAGVTRLVLPRFEQLVLPGLFPDSVTHLNLGGSFNQILLPDVLPRSLTHLILEDGVSSSDFNQPLISLPVSCSLQHEQEQCEPQMIHSLPRSLTHLAFSSAFNQPLAPNALPPNLEHVAFGRSFQQPLPAECLPKSLVKLTVHDTYTGDLSHVEANVRTLHGDDPVEWRRSWCEWAIQSGY